MNIIYVSNDNKNNFLNLKESGDNFISLWSDNWDDFGYKTTLNANAYINGVEIELPRIKIYIDKVKNTSKYLDSLLNDGWDGLFPIKGHLYISQPVLMDFYELILGHTDTIQTKKCAESLHDASYCIMIQENEDLIKLSNDEAFSISLLRDRSASVALQDGFNIFKNTDIEISDFKLSFDINNDNKEIKFEFNEELLPKDINVLIGANGCGKSQTLHKMVNKWLNPSSNKSVEFSDNVNAKKLIVVSYSPFELFPVDLNDYENISDKSVYSYFGLRRRVNSFDKTKKKIRISRNYPQVDAVDSILNCISDDIKFSKIKGWSNKVDTALDILKYAVNFDFIALELSNKVREDEVISDILYFRSPIFIFNEKRYLKISNDTNGNINLDVVKDNLNKVNGVCFFKEGELVPISSGQRLFTYIVINILGSIKKNSLVIVDEPELFLHPNLEIIFISMLKKVLKNYFSKAILATHSLVTVREVPRKCVHVFKKEKNETFIKKPPFETFGCDMQRISSYVFGDKSVSKPYEDWISEKIKLYGSPEALIKKMGADINEEMIVQIHSMSKDKWF
ncbi:AAA family ATPase [Photobacterium leiognathi]|uniref:AAA family ATPase n=1 Tax=Photobacterium leiognathi TaxID=553611 RepID=UPI003AF37EB7